jgi:hypothetical protein
MVTCGLKKKIQLLVPEKTLDEINELMPPNF